MDTEPLSFLVVDDSQTILKFAKNVLNNTFFESKIDVADNASDALVLMQTYCYDVVVMDILMPEISGLEATKRFRSQEESSTQLLRNNRMKIVGMSSLYDDSILDAAEECGMDFFAPKTCPEDFVRAVKAVLAAPSRFVTKKKLKDTSSEVPVLKLDRVLQSRKVDDATDSSSLATLLQISHSYYFPS